MFVGLPVRWNEPSMTPSRRRKSCAGHGSRSRGVSCLEVEVQLRISGMWRSPSCQAVAAVGSASPLPLAECYIHHLSGQIVISGLAGAGDGCASLPHIGDAVFWNGSGLDGRNYDSKDGKMVCMGGIGLPRTTHAVRVPLQPVPQTGAALHAASTGY